MLEVPELARHVAPPRVVLLRLQQCRLHGGRRFTYSTAKVGRFGLGDGDCLPGWEKAKGVDRIYIRVADGLILGGGEDLDEVRALRR